MVQLIFFNSTTPKRTLPVDYGWALLGSYWRPRQFLKRRVPSTVLGGIAIDPTLKKLYYIDSVEREVLQSDFNAALGTICNQETISTLQEHNIEGMADGQTINTDGNLWVAILDGTVIKIDPRKPETLLQTVELPVKQVTSVASGGRNLDELYVTDGNVAIDDIVAPTGDGSGFTFVVKGLEVKGLPAENVKL